MKLWPDNLTFGKSGTPGGPSSFLPDDYLQRKSEMRAALLSLALFGVVLAGVTGAFFVTSRQWTSVSERQKQVSEEYQAEADKIELLAELEAQREELLERAEVAAMVLEKVPRSILLSEVINRLPDQVALTEVELKSKRIKEDVRRQAKAAPKSLSAKTTTARPGSKTTAKAGAKGAAAGKGGKNNEPERLELPRPQRIEFSLIIEGVSTSDTSIADFQTALREVPLLASVEVMSSTEQMFMETPIRKFRIDATLRQDADVRSIEPLRVARSSGRGNAPATANAGSSGQAGNASDARSILAQFLSQRRASGPSGPAGEPEMQGGTGQPVAAPEPGPTASVNEQP
ncbi:MAG: PilN domain-containing protein [Phycisphaerales bacterium]|jgi:Tfp pilus assembly protein PilN|nr:PilN domain-containing protein [Phycisphaeraceae bacterium]